MRSNAEGSPAGGSIHEMVTTTPRLGLVHRLPMTIRSFVQAVLIILFSAVAIPCSFAQVPVDRMEQIVRSYSDSHQFMGSVLVAQGDQVVFEKSYGGANLEWNVP